MEFRRVPSSRSTGNVYNRSVSRDRGFTLIEVLFALLIIGFVLTTSLAIFYERERRLRAAEELVIAAQAVSTETEHLRQVAFGSLATGERAWLSTPSILSRLQNPSTRVTIENELYYKRAIIEIVWNDGRQKHTHVMHRTDVAGGLF
jgi:prepilin-type N-terminal cleavage/methylation domain-containing protein